MSFTDWIPITDPSLKNDNFSIFNIPFGVCSFPQQPRPRCCTAIGDYAVDLSVLAEAGMFDNIANLSSPTFVLSQPTLNLLMQHPKQVWVDLRNTLISLFAPWSKDDRLKKNRALRNAVFYLLSTVTMHLPATIGDYTDFYSSREHATNVGSMFRDKQNALNPNWLHLPVAYHGRSSTVFISGTDVRRPCGQLQKNPNDPSEGSIFGPSQLLDFEVEIAFFVGGARNENGKRLTIEEASDRIFGFVLMNDWSARDVQKWEYVPLGPFGSKNFATTISPWVITTMALEQFTCPTSAKVQHPPPLDYLQDPNYASYNIQLRASIQGPGMSKPAVVCQTNYGNMYWNARQQLVHHSVTGCILQAGDLLGSGTISGTCQDSFGSMLELSWKGSHHVPLGESGQTRKFLCDGDVVIIEGFAENETGKIGFGPCACMGKVLPPILDNVHQETPQLIISTPELEDRYQNFRLYGNSQSSATWRVRIALCAKDIPYELKHVENADYVRNGERRRDEVIQYLDSVPTLEFKDVLFNKTCHLTQSLAIIDFIEEVFPQRGQSLYPKDMIMKVHAKELAETVNSDIQPLTKKSVVKQLGKFKGPKCELGGFEFAKEHMEFGLKKLEILIRERRLLKTQSNNGPYVCGTFSPTIADACIIPQLMTARRFGVDLADSCPLLVDLEKRCLKHKWFLTTHPDQFDENDNKRIIGK